MMTPEQMQMQMQMMQQMMALRELAVEEADYHKSRVQAAKDINSLHREYGRMKQEERIKQRERAKAGEPGTSNA